MYIGTGILKVCVNAEIRHKRLQKVELGSRNAKKLNFLLSQVSENQEMVQRGFIISVWSSFVSLYRGCSFNIFNKLRCD